MNIAESTPRLKSDGTVAVLVATTVIAAGTPILLTHLLASDEPPRPVPVVQQHVTDR